MTVQKATIAVVPRERFSYTRPSLESICRHTTPPFKLVYVDGGSPAPVRRYLAAEAQQRGFRLVRTEGYLSPNQARNVALPHVTTEYVVFVDNDVVVRPGWLDTLVACADETGAAVVGPIYYKGKPGSESIHMAGGQARITEANGKRVFYEKHRHAGKDHTSVAGELKREPCELVEFHTMLVRSEVFRQLGPLDESLFSALEHVDLCLAVRERGGSVYLEPNAAITYVPPPPFALSDYPYFMLRWSDTWNDATVEHFRRKWRLEDDDPSLEQLAAWLRRHRQIYFKAAWKLIYPVLGWRRANAIEGALNCCVARLVEPRGLGHQ